MVSVISTTGGVLSHPSRWRKSAGVLSQLYDAYHAEYDREMVRKWGQMQEGLAGMKSLLSRYGKTVPVAKSRPDNGVKKPRKSRKA